MKNAILFLAGSCLLFGSCSTQKDEPLFDSAKIYKILPVDNFDQANTQDCIRLSELDIQSGFIHTSFGNQVLEIAKKFFKGAGPIIVLNLDKAVLEKNGTELRVEANKPGGTQYPHLYGNQRISIDTVKSTLILYEDSQGNWSKEK